MKRILNTTDFSYTLLTKLGSRLDDGAFVAAETQDVDLREAEGGVRLPVKVFGVGSWATADFIKLTGDASKACKAAVPYASTMTPKNKALVLVLLE